MIHHKNVEFSFCSLCVFLHLTSRTMTSQHKAVLTAWTNRPREFMGSNIHTRCSSSSVHQVEGEEGGPGTGLGLGEWSDSGIGLEWRLPGSSSSSLLPPPPLPFPPPAPCPSIPSEFSSISWMRGGMEPGISIFSVITRSAPVRKQRSASRSLSV